MISLAQFRRLVERFIMPLVAGTTIRECRGACPVYAIRNPPTSIRLSLDPREGRHRVLFLSRSQAFTEDEVKLSGEIVRKWASVFRGNHIAEAYFDVIAERCQVETIAEFMDFSARACLLRILDTMAAWGGQSYEGQRIAFSVGLEEQDATENDTLAPTFMELRDEDFLKVMTSGYDTLLVCDRQGRLLRHDTLIPAPMSSSWSAAELHDDISAMEQAYAPVHFLPIARWAAGGRYALSLNREGEILLFKDKTLLFVRRRGQWIFFTHSAYIAGLGRRGQKVAARKALYQTVLDVSFKRSGGCIGLWNPRHRRDATCIAGPDRLDVPGGGPHEESMSPKSRFLRQIISGRKFQDLPRKLRQELVSIDGATVILHDGTILTVGAILKIEGGSTGGGRTAAAMELAKKGVGVKISNDGKIAYWMDLDQGRERSLWPKYEIG